MLIGYDFVIVSRTQLYSRLQKVIKLKGHGQDVTTCTVCVGARALFWKAYNKGYSPEEMEERSQRLFVSSSSSGLNQITKNRNRSNGAKLDRVKLTRQSQSAQSTCGHCGDTGHSSNRQEREGVCKAYNISCNKCKKLGHYRQFCKKVSDQIASIEH